MKNSVDFTCSETYQIRKDGTESKPKKCPYPGCNFTHYDGYKLQAHYKKAHENIKPFECKACGSSYVQLKDVCVHIATKHENWSKEYANANFRFAESRIIKAHHNLSIFKVRALKLGATKGGHKHA